MQKLIHLDPIDYLVIGHITKDLTSGGPRMGGTASYSALTAKALGLRVGIITSWYEEISQELLQGITILNHTSKTSTTFENIYMEDGRYQIIHSLANPLKPNLIPKIWENTPIVHLGPIANEVSSEVIHRFPQSLIGVTPQGWLRSWDDQGRIFPTKWEEASEMLTQADVTILSIEDVGGNEDTIQEMVENSKILVVTEGYRGSRVYWNGDVRRFQADPVEEVDATGAGDIFATCYFFRLRTTQNPWESARFANSIAARSVTRSGLASIPFQEEIKKTTIEVL